MKLHSDSFPHKGVMPTEFAFAQIDPKSRVKFAANKNPHFVWSDVPENTRSFVMLCVDATSPTDPADVNQTDREVPADLPRADFSHWVLINIPANTHDIQAGQFSHEVTPKGKAGPLVAGLKESPLRQGINDYTHWFAGDHDMEGDYYGYDGPCPPWNDSLVHQYTFTLYALAVDAIPLPTDGKLNQSYVMAHMQEHILASASWTGGLHLNAPFGKCLGLLTLKSDSNESLFRLKHVGNGHAVNFHLPMRVGISSVSS